MRESTHGGPDVADEALAAAPQEVDEVVAAAREEADAVLVAALDCFARLRERGRDAAADTLAAANEEAAALIASARTSAESILERTRAEATRLLAEATNEAEELTQRLVEAERQSSAVLHEAGGRPAQPPAGAHEPNLEAPVKAPAPPAVPGPSSDTATGEPLIGSRGHGVRAAPKKRGRRTRPPEQ